MENIDKSYKELAIAFLEDPGDHRIIHEQLKIYKQIIMELVSGIDNANQWIKSGGPEFIAMNDLTKRATEAKNKLPWIYE